MFMRASTIEAVRSILGESSGRIDRLMKYADCADSRHYLDALRLLLASDGELRVNLGDGAAPLRFFVALAASLPGKRVEADGSDQLRRRPISPLVETLRKAGAQIKYLEKEGEIPLRICGRKLTGRGIDVDTSHTSQYLSALMLSAPLWEERPDFGSVSSAVSSSYVAMTRRMLEEKTPEIERDWSAASFFYEIIALARVAGCNLPRKLSLVPLIPPGRSLQGDSACCEIFGELGVKTVFKDDATEISYEEGEPGRRIVELDLASTPDLIPPVVVAMVMRGIPFRITGSSHLRYKESDRGEVLKRELRKLGYELTVREDSLAYAGDLPANCERDIRIDPHGDHRIAMAFAPVELLGLGEIMDKEVVSKSFPGFWKELEEML